MFSHCMTRLKTLCVAGFTGMFPVCICPAASLRAIASIFYNSILQLDSGHGSSADALCSSQEVRFESQLWKILVWLWFDFDIPGLQSANLVFLVLCIQI